MWQTLYLSSQLPPWTESSASLLAHASSSARRRRRVRCAWSVEPVRPTINDAPRSLAFSLIGLVSKRGDVGKREYRLPPKTRRTNVFLGRSASRRNATRSSSTPLSSTTSTHQLKSRGQPVLVLAHQDHTILSKSACWMRTKSRETLIASRYSYISFSAHLTRTRRSTCAGQVWICCA